MGPIASKEKKGRPSEYRLGQCLAPCEGKTINIKQRAENAEWRAVKQPKAIAARIVGIYKMQEPAGEVEVLSSHTDHVWPSTVASNGMPS